MAKALSSIERRPLLRRAAILCVISLSMTTGCTPAQNLEGGADRAPNTPQSPAENVLGAQSADALRRAYPGLNGGDACHEDDHCDAPLRCIAQECAFPPAMTGEVSPNTPRVIIHSETGAHAYYLELAIDLEQQRRGLMHREHMAENFGMLFVYDAPRPQSFWMKNTLIPLDMLFIGEDLRVGSIVERAKPKSRTPRSSSAPAQYVLELVGGQSAQHRLQAGDRVEFFDLPPAR